MLLRNGHLVDPSQAIDGVTDIRIENGVVSEVGPDLPEQDGEEIFDLSGCYVMLGLIDTHVHLRDPGQEESEDLESGSKAAIAGGFTTVVAMPNTFPVVDNVPIVRYIKDKSARLGYADVLPTAAITKGQEGQEITEIGFLRDAGVIAFTEDGKSVANSGILRKAMTYSKPYDVLFMSHCEDKDLKGAGCMNAGALATEMGLGGIANEVEDIIIMRDIMLAKMTGVRLHIQHLSTASGLELVREAKAKGLPVTCEVTPHHLWFDDSRLTYRVNPPIRKADDVTALIDAIKDGTVTCIGTDHAPHTAEEKEKGAAGMVGLETAFGVCYTKLCREQRLPLEMLSFLMSAGPAAVLGLADRKGMLDPGYDADIVLVDLDHMYEVHADELHSKSKNCPYDGALLYGKVVTTIKGGKVTFQIEE